MIPLQIVVVVSRIYKTFEPKCLHFHNGFNTRISRNIYLKESYIFAVIINELAKNQISGFKLNEG